jgi:glycerophosphoryl diester phosphodiesterase
LLGALLAGCAVRVADRDEPPASAAIAASEPALDCTAPLLMGHRGTRAHAPENTLEAYRWAVDNGADGLEIDVRMTADGQLVSLHDTTVGRTTDHPADVALAGLTLSELQRLDAGAWFDADYAGARVPSLAEIFTAFARTPALYLLDVKGAEVSAELVALLDAHAARGRAIFASDRLDVLHALHDLAPDIPALYFLAEMHEVDDIAPASVRYLRVPKAVEADPAHVRRIVDAGYGAVTSARYVAWDGPDSALTALSLADDAAAAVERRAQRRPYACQH